MKRPKDRLYRVIVVGATPAGISAVNKLGELGIPTTLVDADGDLDQKLSKDEWKLKTGIPFNHAHRSGLIRILRNPTIQCIMPAKVTSIKHMSQGFRVGIKKQETFVDPARCTLCGKCIEACPVLLPEGKKPLQFTSRLSLPGRPVIDKRRKPLCQENCPLGVNVQGYITLAKTGKFAQALALIRENNVLPGICGRICTHPCEAACRRGELDEPLAIRDIKRFIADHELASDKNAEAATPHSPPREKRKEKIAVIGSGPAGLAAASDLARLGFQVTVFEKEKMTGGLLRYGIGAHRLPREILDLELKQVEALGIKFITNHPVDPEKDLAWLKDEYDAVLFSTGVWADTWLGVPGEALEGVHGCLDFLTRFYRGEIDAVEGKVAVIGDGNSAFDLARTLTRIGVDVTILSWFPEALIPADAEEVNAAKAEGIPILCSLKTIEFSGENGKLNRILCKPTEPGKPDAKGIPWPVIVPDSATIEIPFDHAFVAIGQKSPFRERGTIGGIEVTPYGYFKVDERLRTNIKGVYATGDAVNGPSSVVHAMTSGRKAAQRIYMDIDRIKDEEIPISIYTKRPEDRDFPDIPEEIPSAPRPIPTEKQPSLRKKSFEEVSLGLSEAQVLFESGRCLQCGVCCECFQCVEACGEINAVNHLESLEPTVEHAGVVIIADPSISPETRGEDVIRAYGPKAAKSDVYAMMLRGYAAAAKAMILLGGNAQRPKGHGISFSPPDPGLSSEIRLGVFICRCNESLGWMGEMDDYIKSLASQSGIVHAEVLSSACVPEGSLSILRTIREKGITRVVLASCVCCPLNFICSACTDQRSRLKNALFSGAGLSRSMIETCNLRGEVLRLVKKEPAMALLRFTGLINRSVIRARKLKPFSTPARAYNFTTAIIGESEATIESARILAEAGMEVFLFGTSKKPLTETLSHPNVHNFRGSSVKGLSGTIGNFQVFIEADGFTQSLQAGAVILGEKSRKTIPYLHQEGLPSCTISSDMQDGKKSGIPFFYPGATTIPGLFLADPPGINVSNKKKGTAAAVKAVALMPRGPRQSKGFTVVIDKDLCRGCGRCVKACTYQAVTLHKNSIGGWNASVDEALCKGCGNCISVCPSNAADSPYRDQGFLEQTLEELLG